MPQYDDQPVPDQDPQQLAWDQLQRAMGLGEALMQEQSVVRFADTIGGAISFEQRAAGQEGRDPTVPLLAIVGVGIGAANNDPAKRQVATEHTGQLIKVLEGTSLDDEHKQIYREQVGVINRNPGNLNMLSDVMGGALSYARAREAEGQDMTAFKTLFFATGFTASKDTSWRGMMASELHRLVTPAQ